ncbi:MAG: hypothetical protein E6I88_14565 [Chloroflexi bacterium]|nr:MAG: hypothetical protein E6I88_14565 [Chloroflexota bacterium]TME44221.1 MAG: hypothetical protein E6I56_12855 [Chloroflexota bacterium]
MFARFITEYRDENDIVGTLAGECVIQDSQARTKTSEVYSAFRAWCIAQGLPLRFIIGDQRLQPR